MLKKNSLVQLAILCLTLAAVATGLSYLHVTITQCAHISCTGGVNFTDRGWPAPITTNGGFNLSSTIFDLVFWFLALFAAAGFGRLLVRGTFVSWFKRNTLA